MRLDDMLDWLLDHWMVAIMLFIAVIVALGYIDAQYEAEYPCLEYGPERVEYFQKIGDMMVPVYSRPCIHRSEGK